MAIASGYLSMMLVVFASAFRFDADFIQFLSDSLIGGQAPQSILEKDGGKVDGKLSVFRLDEVGGKDSEANFDHVGGTTGKLSDETKEDEEVVDLTAKVEALNRTLHSEEMEDFENAMAGKNRILEEQFGQIEELQRQNANMAERLAQLSPAQLPPGAANAAAPPPGAAELSQPELERMQEEMAKAKEQRPTVAKEVKRLTGQVIEVDNGNKEITARPASLAEEREKLLADVHKKTDERDKLKAEAAAAKEESSAVKEQRATIAKEVQRLTNKVIEVDGENRELEARTASMAQEREKLLEDVQENTAERDQLEAVAEAAKQDIATTKEQRATVAKEAQRLTGKVISAGEMKRDIKEQTIDQVENIVGEKVMTAKVKDIKEQAIDQVENIVGENVMTGETEVSDHGPRPEFNRSCPPDPCPNFTNKDNCTSHDKCLWIDVWAHRRPPHCYHDCPVRTNNFTHDYEACLRNEYCTWDHYITDKDEYCRPKVECKHWGGESDCCNFEDDCKAYGYP